VNTTEVYPTWVEVDLDAVKYNLKQVQQKLTPEAEIIAIVKANAYGHGLLKIAKAAIKFGAERLGVATVEEGKKLRKAGVKAPILILGTLNPAQIPLVANYNLTPTVYTYQTANQLAEAEGKVKVHIKVDTGMGRIGCLPLEAPALIKKINQLSNLEVEGMFSHFAAADEDEDYTRQQLASFQQVQKRLREAGIEIPLFHLANSAALINYPETHYQAVRMGLILYGLYPEPGLQSQIDLKPVMTWKARIAHVKELPPGKSISYGCTYTTSRPTKVATIPVGYHDGYPRGLSNQSEVLYQGKRYPVIGRVCMDQFMVDMTGTEAEKGEVVTLLGKDRDSEITAGELAELMDTINYEIICRVGSRVPRIYNKDGEWRMENGK